METSVLLIFELAIAFRSQLAVCGWSCRHASVAGLLQQSQMLPVAALAISNQFEIVDDTKLLQHIAVLSLVPLMLDLSLIVQAATITESIVPEPGK